MVLADHGAEVIAVESPHFKEDDLYFTDLYRNKRHMCLNLKSEEGKGIFYQLANKADIILEGFRPGVAARLGVDYDSVVKSNPSVIYCSISGYGQTGSMSHEAGHDVNYLSKAGVLDLIGEKEGAPIIPAVQLADISGALHGVIGILLALQEREKSGIGQYIDISMTDSLLGYLAVPFSLSKKGLVQKRSSSLFSHRYGCYNTYKTSDGKHFSIGAVENRFWKNLCTKIGLEKYIPLQYDEDSRKEIIAALREMFSSHTLAHWQQILEGADVCFAKVSNMAEVIGDDFLREREMIATVPGDDEEKCIGIPIKLERTPGKIATAPQEFGEATTSILQDLGYDEESIKRFFDKGVV